MKKFMILAALIGSLFAIPATASASFSSEMKAGNRAEQKLQRSIPATAFTASAISRAAATGARSAVRVAIVSVSGHAWVSRYYRVRLVGVTRSCF